MSGVTIILLIAIFFYYRNMCLKKFREEIKLLEEKIKSKDFVIKELKERDK